MKKHIKAAGSQSLKREAVLSDPFIFPWVVYDPGYHWVKGADHEPHLVPRLEPGARKIPRESPKGAFIEFAKLKPEEDAIVAFANKYGDLFEKYGVKDLVPNYGRATGGARLSRWRAEIGDMRVLFDLWSDVRKRRLSRLKKTIEWRVTDSGRRYVNYYIETPTGSSDTELASTRDGGWGNENFTDGDVLLPARCALQMEVNKRLEKYPTVPRLNWTPDKLETSGGYSERLIFRPPNLLSAMWLRFAEAITKGLEFRQCVCGTYFQVGPGSGKRADSQYHDDICRVNAWQERRNKEAAKK